MATVLELHDGDKVAPIHVVSPFDVSTSTPVKDSSHNAPSEIKAQVKERLWTEMKNGGWVNDPRLLDRFVSHTDIRPSFSFPRSVTHENQLHGPLSVYFNALATSSSMRFINISSDYPHQTGYGAQTRIRPDLLGLDKSDAKDYLSGGTLFWRSVKMFCKIKPGNQHKQWLDAREQAAMFSRQIFRNHPGRRFVFGIVWCHPMFELWLFDRSGGVVSDQHSIYEKTRIGRKAKRTHNSTTLSLLSRIITTITQFDDSALGYDPNVSIQPVAPSEREDTDPSQSEDTESFHNPRDINRSEMPDDTHPHDGVTITLEAQDGHPLEEFTVERVLFSRNSLRGRATQVWLVCRKTDNVRFIMKDAWREYERRAEWEWYQTGPESDYLPIIYRHGIVKIDGEEDTTELCRRGCGSTDKDGKRLPTVQRRVHERILFKTHGSLLRECKDFGEVLRTVRDAVKGHRDLYNADILHRDISINNILRDAEHDRGFLIDLDQAARVKSDDSPMTKYRSGTLPFMAAEVLLNEYIDPPDDDTPFCHAYHHDLESFVWVLVSLAISTVDYERARTFFAEEVSELSADKPALKTISVQKNFLWMNKTRLWTKLGSHLQGHPLLNAINALHCKIEDTRKSNINDPIITTSLYEDFVNILDTAAKDPNAMQSHDRLFEPSTPSRTSRPRVKKIVSKARQSRKRPFQPSTPPRTSRKRVKTIDSKASPPS